MVRLIIYVHKISVSNCYFLLFTCICHFDEMFVSHPDLTSFSTVSQCHFLLFAFYCFFLHFVLLRFLFPIFFLTCLQFSSLTNFIFLCDFQSVQRCLCLCLSTFLSLCFSLYVLYTSSLFLCPSCLFLIHVHSRLRPCLSPVRLHHCLSDSSLLYTFSLCLCLPFSLLSSHLTD